MIIRNHARRAQLAYLKLRTDQSQRSTAYLIEPQTFFFWLVVANRIIRK